GYDDVNAWSCVDQVPNGDRQLDAGTARRVARWRAQTNRNAATTAARITRYQAKASRLWRRRKFRRKRMTSQPQIPEVRMPTTSATFSSCAMGTSEPRRSSDFLRHAPKVMGVASRNEKRAASSRRSPHIIPVTMVIPERDTPGIKAI